MLRFILRFGLVSGLLMVGLFILSWVVVGNNPDNYSISEVIGYSTMVLCLSLIFMATHRHRQAQPASAGYSYGRGLVLGLGVTAIASVLFGLYSAVLMTVVEPEFADQYYQHYIEQVRQDTTMTPAQQEAHIAQMNADREMFSNPVMQFLVMSLTVFPVGLLISLVSAAIFRRRAGAALTSA